MIVTRGLLGIVLALLVVEASAVDRVRLLSGKEETGRITRVTPEGLTLQGSAGESRISVEDVKRLAFDGEPLALTQARINVAALGYTTALKRLEGLNPSDLPSDLIRQEAQFYTAYCRAQLALAGAGDPAGAEKALTAFVRGARQSLHYYAVVQTLGDLMVAGERYDRAERFYALLDKAEAPSLRVRARRLAGRVSQARDDHESAIRRFDAAISLGRPSEATAVEQRNARLGKAESLAATDKLPEARELVAKVVRQIASDDGPAQAAAYNALGRAHEAANDPTGALLAYLHTDLLFNQDAETHAEALARLAPLWRESGKPEAARDATERLRRRYASSRWARGSGGST